MPGSSDVSGFNVQFGALDFGSEAAAVDVAQKESSREQAPLAPSAVAALSIPSAAMPTQQPQSLFSKPASVRCVRLYCMYDDVINFIYPNSLHAIRTANT